MSDSPSPLNSPTHHPAGVPPVLPAITAESLGSGAFRAAHGLRYAYLSGAMYKGIASVDLVARMGRAGLMGFFGTGGLRLERIEEAILALQRQLGPTEPYGMNLLCNLIHPAVEEATVDLYLRHRVRRIEAAAYTQVTPSLVRYRLQGLDRDATGRIVPANLIMAKVSRPEVAGQFLQPAPAKIVQRLLETNRITAAQAALAPLVPMADDLCIEADSGGHTDNGVALCLLPVMLRLRDEAAAVGGTRVRVGAAGGLGTPHAIAAAFTLGADFVLTGSINQCTVEAGTSDLVKDLLATINVQDTAMAPAGDMFEIGAKVQVLSKGVFFPARANKLYDLYRQYDSLEQIDEKTRTQLETRYFKRTFAEVYEETRQYYLRVAPEQIERAEKNPKAKMALVFRWYFVQSNRLAQRGVAEGRVDFQVHTGPALGAFNQWVRGTPLADWRQRHADEIGLRLMREAAALLDRRCREFHGWPVADNPGWAAAG
jgi:trans-AT polyketide synthase/acyltransferase/oxidoreductase domain-containing protein